MFDITELILGALGIMSGFIIPLGVFFWLYKDAKNKREAVIAIAKTANDPERVQEFLDTPVSYTHLTLPTILRV